VVAVPAREIHVGVSLVQPPGSLAAIVGLAAERTAVARVVAGVAAPESGRVLVGDDDVTGLPPVERKIGYVPAGGALLPHLTARQNIEYGLRYREHVAEMHNKWQRDLIVQLELGSVLDRHPHELSPPRRLRVALARTMVSLPEVLLIDLPDVQAVGGTLSELLQAVQSQDAEGQLSTVVLTADGKLAEGAETLARVVAL
jgi:ABC-type Fe3+/spermidine/putrescine transport system ATPase subunit